MLELNENGRKWARAFLLIALAVSVIGNITHTYRADSDITLWLRIPGAVVWPVFTWGAIEIVVRIVWASTWAHRIARATVLFPAIPAAITSYEHLYNLLGMMGERTLIQWIGPAAIDGLMIGCTLTLLFTRQLVEEAASVVKKSHSLSTIFSQPESTGYMIPEQVREVLNEVGPELGIEPVSPAAPAAPSEPKTRAPRATWNARQVCEMAVDGIGRTKANEVAGIGMSTYDRYVRAAKTLKINPSAEIPTTWKVPADHIRIMREMIQR